MNCALWHHVTGSVQADHDDRCEAAMLGSVGYDVSSTGDEQRAPRLT